MFEGVVAAAAGVLARGVGRLPPAAGAALGAALGWTAYGLLPGRRQVALENAGRAFADADPQRIRRLVRANFRHLGTTAVECCRLFFGPPGAVLGRVRAEGLEHVERARRAGCGVLFLTAHFGNWELLGACHALGGFPLHVVVRPLDNAGLERLLARGRTRGGLRLIPKRQAARTVPDALARGECVGILLDQDAGRDGVFVPFLGRPASTSRGLAILARRTGAPVLPAFIRRLPGGDHLLTIDPPLALARSGDRQADVEENTARFSAEIARVVRQHPEQWFWVHRRWKTPPPIGPR
jgi:KDO2-lipid IV(A) lauroyltransferase